MVHLFCMHDESVEACRYFARIRPWATRTSAHIEAHEHAFSDQWDLIETINPLLPRGSDVRHVLSHIESPDGFLYLLHLSSEQAGSVGWCG